MILYQKLLHSLDYPVLNTYVFRRLYISDFSGLLYLKVQPFDKDKNISTEFMIQALLIKHEKSMLGINDVYTWECRLHNY